MDEHSKEQTKLQVVKDYYERVYKVKFRSDVPRETIDELYEKLKTFRLTQFRYNKD